MITAIPEPWSTDPYLLTMMAGRGIEAAHVSDGALVLAVTGRRGRGLVGWGAAAPIRDLVLAHGDDAGWMTVPRATGDLLTAADLAGLGLVHGDDWDWFVTRRAPAVQPGEDDVVELDREAVEEELKELLAEANPRSDADPARPARWFGVRAGGRLIGVIAAIESGGPGPGTPSRHLQGLAVRPEARGRRLGAALTAAATRAGLAEVGPQSWVSLGMYADNARARRIYDALGYVTHARNSSYRAPAPA